jgi:hypothetical protein
MGEEGVDEITRHIEGGKHAWPGGLEMYRSDFQLFTQHDQM